MNTPTSEKFGKLSNELSQYLDKSHIITDPALCYVFGTDASFYRLTPKIIIKVRAVNELVKVIKCCRQLKLPYTFRAAGTSLSGQSISDSVLIMLTDDWQNYEILEQGNKIKLQPGIIGAVANRYLAPYQRKIGPDPASIDSCKIGGIAANNASGMCCGTAHNSYKTLVSMTIVLGDGSVVDTGDPESVALFRNTHSWFLGELGKLALQTRDDEQLYQLIRTKYRIKNTSGYSLNALIDFQDPVNILQHLMIGSEGTLGFIADLTYQTVPESPCKASALIVYDCIETACEAVTELSETQVAAVELMDGRAMQSIAGQSDIVHFDGELTLEASALLLECQAETEDELYLQTRQVNKAIASFKPIKSVRFTSDHKTCQDLWKIRKGLFPSVGAVKEKGTSVIIEDIAFPVEKLAAGTRDLRQLLQKHGYTKAIIFGHALNGNLHFVFTQNFECNKEVKRYKQFMQDLSGLVAIKYRGSLKAEHGTGRNMAPFVELEWGTRGYRLMQKIKSLFDPNTLMNPGVIINADPNSHVTNLKTLPEADDLIDQCTECGFCESVCPSRNLSLTPRQRIVMYRRIRQLQSNKQLSLAKKLTKQFNYLGIDTCAATGLCTDQCPVGINTGELIKKLRYVRNQETDNQLLNRLVKWTANHFALTTSFIRIIFHLSHLLQRLLPNKTINSVGKNIHRLSNKTIPIWFDTYPSVNNRKFISSKVNKTDNTLEKCIVYFPSCVSRTLGTQVHAVDRRPLAEVTTSLLEKAGYRIIIPDTITEACCGMPYDSKGIKKVAEQKYRELETILWQASCSGEIPVLMDTSPCAKHTIENLSKNLKIYEPTEFAITHLVNQLQIEPIDETIMLHITCSSRRLGLADKMFQLASQCAAKVIIPDGIHCCGWAGDKGFFVPELNQLALTSLKNQIPEGCTRGFSNSLTCEIGLSQHGGIPYQSILYLLDEVSTDL